MTARRYISYGLIAGMTLAEVLASSPGFVADMYIAKVRYDDDLHGITRKNPAHWEDD